MVGWATPTHMLCSIYIDALWSVQRHSSNNELDQRTSHRSADQKCALGDKDKCTTHTLKVGLVHSLGMHLVKDEGWVRCARELIEGLFVLRLDGGVLVA